VQASDLPAIELRGLSKSFGAVAALAGLSLTVRRGEVFGFLGPNGAGKTTTLRILLDLLRPNAGSASVLGYDCQRQSVEARRRTGYLPGELNLYDSLTGRQTLRLFASLRPGSVDPAFRDRLLDRLDLDPSISVGAYSKGNKQKLGLLLAMMHRPDVLVLDEPTSGLDPLVQEEIALLLKEGASNGQTVFFSSHVLPEVERMCQRVGIIRRGRLVAVEDVAALKGRSLHIIEVTFREAPPAGAFAIPGVREVQRDGRMVHLEVHNNLDAALKAIARYEVLDLRTEQPSLEQVFLAYYHETPNSRPDGQEAPAVAS
jgi:ABC-2 type transport system ATP-binding protein